MMRSPVDVGAPKSTSDAREPACRQDRSERQDPHPQPAVPSALQIAIDPTNLPVDAEIPMTELEVTPSDRAGVLARFGVRRDVLRPRGVPHGRRSGRSGRHSWRVVGQETELVMATTGRRSSRTWLRPTQQPSMLLVAVPPHRLRQRQLAGGHRSGDLQMSRSLLPLAIAPPCLRCWVAPRMHDLRVYDRQPGLRQHRRHHQRAVHDHRQLRRDLLLPYWRSRCAPAPMSVPARAAATHRGTRDI